MSKIAFIGERATGKTARLVQWVLEQIADGKEYIAFIGASRNLFDAVILPTFIRECDSAGVEINKVNKPQGFMKIGSTTVRYYAFGANPTFYLGMNPDVFQAIAVDEFTRFWQDLGTPVIWRHAILNFPELALTVSVNADTDIKELVQMLPPDTAMPFMPVLRK